MKGLVFMKIIIVNRIQSQKGGKFIKITIVSRT